MLNVRHLQRGGNSKTWVDFVDEERGGGFLKWRSLNRVNHRHTIAQSALRRLPCSITAAAGEGGGVAKGMSEGNKRHSAFFRREGNTKKHEMGLVVGTLYYHGQSISNVYRYSWNANKSRWLGRSNYCTYVVIRDREKIIRRIWKIFIGVMTCFMYNCRL